MTQPLASPSRTRLVSATLRRRSTIRLMLVAATALLAISSVFDHLHAFGYPGNDWQTFDRQSFTVTKVLSGDTFTIGPTTVRLLGIDASAANYADHSLAYLKARIESKAILLRLDGTATRDPAGNLLAYAFFTDADQINLDAIRDGQAFADRRTTHSFHAQFEQSESDARKHQRGLWKSLAFRDIPLWRQAWLKARQGG